MCPIPLKPMKLLCPLKSVLNFDKFLGTTPATKPCGDVNDNCSSWKNQYSSWFTERCTGSKKNEKPSQVSPLTMGEACQKSCGLCGGNMFKTNIQELLDSKYLFVS